MGIFTQSEAVSRALTPITTKASSVRVPTEGDDSLDRLLSGSWKGAYERDFSEERLGWIAASTAHHIEHCPQYARIAAAAQFAPEQLQRVQDVARVPLIPSSLFKKKSILSLTEGEILRCRSSGTKGTVSEVCRDERTMERFIAGLLHCSAEFYERHEGRRGYVLGPSAEEAGTLWFSYVLSLLDLSFDTEFFVQGGDFQLEELASALSELPVGTQPLLVGPPILIVDFCRWLESQGRVLDLSGCNALVATAGGWKANAARALDRAELTELVIRVLGVELEAVRDIYNMVELNSLMFECELNNKHVPPWLEVVVRNPSDMKPVAPGEEGVLTYLDPTPTSYPGFIFSEDLGTVSSDTCLCGRVGNTLTLSRRLSNLEARGCALKMTEYSRGQGK